MLLKITLQKNSSLQARRFYWHFSALKTVLNSFGKGNKNVLFLILTFCSLNYSILKRGCFWDCPTHGVNFSILFASPTGSPVTFPLCRAPVLFQIELFIINQTVLLSSVSGQSGIWISCDGLVSFCYSWNVIGGAEFGVSVDCRYMVSQPGLATEHPSLDDCSFLSAAGLGREPEEQKSGRKPW